MTTNDNDDKRELDTKEVKTCQVVAAVVGAVAVILLALLGAGCNDDNNTVAPNTAVDGTLLLGLTNGHTLTYQQVDTVTTFYPEYSRTVSTQTRMLSMAGTGEDWVIRENGQPVINLKVSSPYVLQNGAWKSTGVGDSLIYFLTPPIVMHQQFEKNKNWEGLMPMYPSVSGDMLYPFFNYYFGFYYKRQYVESVQLLTPAGAFVGYRFDVDLFFDAPTHATSAADSLPDATATEYYAKNVGLVKATFTGQGLVRSISLIQSQ